MIKELIKVNLLRVKLVEYPKYEFCKKQTNLYLKEEIIQKLNYYFIEFKNNKIDRPILNYYFLFLFFYILFGFIIMIFS